MPCVELFEEQEESYKESVLPSSVKKRVVVEAAHSFGWHKYTGFDGICITMDRFCLLYTSPSPRDNTTSRMPSSA